MRVELLELYCIWGNRLVATTLDTQSVPSEFSPLEHLNIPLEQLIEPLTTIAHQSDFGPNKNQITQSVYSLGAGLAQGSAFDVCHVLLVLFLGNVPVAFLQARRVFDGCEIDFVGVENSHRRRGLGKALVISLLKMASCEKVNSVTLEVAEKNSPARALYTSLGFKEIARRARYYRNGEDALILEKRL